MLYNHNNRRKPVTNVTTMLVVPLREKAASCGSIIGAAEGLVVGAEAGIEVVLTV
jgi:hypothetical protein